MREVLVLTDDPVGAQMGGNAIRATELARVVATHAHVTLVAPGDGVAGVEHVRLDPRRPCLPRADVIVAKPQGPIVTAAMRRSRAQLIFDLYDPSPLESLATYAEHRSLQRRFWTTLATDAVMAALGSGHRFVCASERQRDLWLGAMLAARLITPSAYGRDRSFRNVLGVVPFGVPRERPRSGPGARARFGLGDDDEVIVWNGGIWNWLDPETAVAAVARLVTTRPRAKLVFMGRPPHIAAEARAADAARELAARRDLLGTTVFFNDRWVPYDERAGWLLDADVAISTHREQLETRFAFRTRLLDCFWACLPVVCTEGDDLADLVRRDGLGATVPPGDEAALAAALAQVLEAGRDAYRDALANAAEAFAWERVAAPLVEMLDADPVPRLAARGRAVELGRALRALAARLRP